MAKASALVRALNPASANDTASSRRLLSTKAAIAEALLDNESKDGLDTAQALLSEMQGKNAQIGRARLLEGGLILLRRQPPDCEHAESIGR